MSYYADGSFETYIYNTDGSIDFQIGDADGTGYTGHMNPDYSGYYTITYPDGTTENHTVDADGNDTISL